MNRRNFIRNFGAGALGLALSPALWAKKSASGLIIPAVPTGTGAVGRVIVVGGGMGGATAVKYLRIWGGDQLEVTLVEPNFTYFSNILSNQVVEGTRSLDSLGYRYTDLSARYGVNHIAQSVVAIDPISHTVDLDNGNTLEYDRLILSPGITFDTIAGLESAEAQAQIPHAWQAGAQTNTLRDQLQQLQNGENVVITIPTGPYRCPPGPYERACVIADFVRQNSLQSKVQILDANSGITAGVNNFTRAFAEIYPDIIEYHPDTEIYSIDASTRTLETSTGSLQANIINAIPNQRAGKIILENDLANVGDGKGENRWAGIDMLTYESTLWTDIHIIGDSAATTQPKAGHIANSEAKVCVDAIIRSLKGEAPYPAPMTNSSCYTPITQDTASWLSAVYRYDSATGTMIPTQSAEAAEISRENFREMGQWFDNLMADTFA